jgi:hypothetical protein
MVDPGVKSIRSSSILRVRCSSRRASPASYVKVEAGETVVVTNTGGRTHTFTEVAQFGGGRVPPLPVKRNSALTTAGAMTGTGGSPQPVGLSPLGTMWTSTAVGASFMYGRL